MCMHAVKCNRTGAHGKKLPVKAKRAPSKRKKAPSKKKFLLGDILLGGVYKSKFLGGKLPVFFYFFLCWEAFYWEQKAPSKTPPSTLGGLNIFFRPPSKKKTIMEFDSILGEFSLETTKFAPVKMLPAQTCSQHVAVEFGRGTQLRPAIIATCCARGRGQTKPLLACIACIARQSWHESVRVKVHTHR